MAKQQMIHRIPNTRRTQQDRDLFTYVGGEFDGIGRGEAGGGEEESGDLHGWNDLEKWWLLQVEQKTAKAKISTCEKNQLLIRVRTEGRTKTYVFPIGVLIPMRKKNWRRGGRGKNSA